MGEPADADRARQQLREAEAELTRLRAALHASRTGMNFDLLRKIGSAEGRVATAHEVLRRIEAGEEGDNAG
jgi:hypothetical protein